MPVMILARLAVDVQHQEAGLGKALLKDALLVKDLKAMLSGRDQAQADQSVVFAYIGITSGSVRNVDHQGICKSAFTFALTCCMTSALTEAFFLARRIFQSRDFT